MTAQEAWAEIGRHGLSLVFDPDSEVWMCGTFSGFADYEEGSIEGRVGEVPGCGINRESAVRDWLWKNAETRVGGRVT